jgi:hypothetical protein
MGEPRRGPPQATEDGASGLTVSAGRLVGTEEIVA